MASSLSASSERRELREGEGGAGTVKMRRVGKAARFWKPLRAMLLSRAQLLDPPREFLGERVIGGAGDREEIEQHPAQDLPRSRRLEMIRGQHEVLRCEESAAFIEAETTSAVEGVEETTAAPDDEMAGESDAVEREPGALPDEQIDQRERDRDAEPRLDDVGQQRVVHVVIIRLVAAQADLMCEVFDERLDAIQFGRGLFKTPCDLRAPRIEQFALVPKIFAGRERGRQTPGGFFEVAVFTELRAHLPEDCVRLTRLDHGDGIAQVARGNGVRIGEERSQFAERRGLLLRELLFDEPEGFRVIVVQQAQERIALFDHRRWQLNQIGSAREHRNEGSTAAPPAGPRCRGLVFARNRLSRTPMQRKSAFTLVEIMIVVAIIALIAGIALPSFMRARKRAQNIRFIAAMKVASEAFQMYAIEHTGYPADVGPAQVPDAMAPYFGKFAWTLPTPIGGLWDWDYGTVGVKAAISAYQPSVSEDQRLTIDEMIDDGNPDTGSVRVTGGRVTYVVEE